MRTKPITTVNYENRAVTLKELAILTGLPHCLLKRRYLDGDRGERLWRPRENTFSGMTVDMLSEDTHRRSIRDRQQRKQSRREEREALQRQRQAEHAAAFARPLICDDILKPAERAAIRKRVLCSGQRNWSIKGTQSA